MHSKGWLLLGHLKVWVYMPMSFHYNPMSAFKTLRLSDALQMRCSKLALSQEGEQAYCRRKLPGSSSQAPVHAQVARASEEQAVSCTWTTWGNWDLVALEVDEQTHSCSGQKGWVSKTFFDVIYSCIAQHNISRGENTGTRKSPLHIHAVYISASEVIFHFWAKHSMFFSRLRKNAVI